jgi:quercetin dioxygenase-like cupin family protein
VATIKATAASTDGGLYMSEAELEPGTPGPPPHTHSTMTDMFYVLEGELSLLIGGEWRSMPAGSFAAAPPGNVHTFANRSDAPVRFLNISTPGGFEAYMRELFALLAAGPPDPAAMADLLARHDVQVVDQPA